MPRDAESWLADRGIERDPIRVPLEPPAPPQDAAPAVSSDVPSHGPAVSAREAGRLVGQAAADAHLADAEGRSLPDPRTPHLEDDVAEAMVFVRRSVAAAPQSEGRVRTKLEERGWSAAVIDGAIQRARRERLVDDTAMAVALVEERRAKGHAASRIRRDLRERGFGDEVLDAALADVEAMDPRAAAFAVARDKAVGLTALPTDKAFRRVAAHVARKGYGDGLARKVARDAVFATRDPQRTAEH